MGHASILTLLIVQAGVLCRLACAERATDEGTFEEVWQQLAHADGASALSGAAGATGARSRSLAAGSEGGAHRLVVEAPLAAAHGGVRSAAGNVVASERQVSAGASERRSEVPVASSLEVAGALGVGSRRRPPEAAAHRSNSSAHRSTAGATSKALVGVRAAARPAAPAASLEALEVTGLQAHLMRGRVVGTHALGSTAAEAAKAPSQAERAAVSAANVSVGDAAFVEVRTVEAAKASSKSAGSPAATPAAAGCHDGIGCRRGGECACASFQQCYPHHEDGEDVGVCQTAMSVLAVGSVVMIVISFTLFTVVRYALEGGEQPSDASTAS